MTSIRMSADDQFKFLLSCVKWSVNGKVDFTEVASECGVVSKGAAAKRYERMLKNHGIHPNGGPLDSPTLPREKMTPAKASKKRKPEEMINSIKHDEDGERKPYIKRSRKLSTRDIKPEQPPMQYQPYMYHPMMPPHGPYMSRMQPYMQSGMQHPPHHQMQYNPQVPQPSFQMTPGMHSNQFFMPHQMQQFPVHQNPPPPAQDSDPLSSFDDFCNQDFGNASYEALLHGEPAAIPKLNDSPQANVLLPYEGSQMSTTSQPELLNPIKAEPSQSPLEAKLCNDKLVSTVPSKGDISCDAKQEEAADASMASEVAIENAPDDADSETITHLKQENDGCIFISD